MDGLIEHPEGGRFREVFRSPRRVHAAQGERSALTHIYFALAAGEFSAWHQVTSDEVWNLYRGELELWLWQAGAATCEQVLLSPTSEHFCAVVPAGTWQAARPISAEVLVGCSVGPGFEFSDFSLLRQGDRLAERLPAAGVPWLASRAETSGLE